MNAMLIPTVEPKDLNKPLPEWGMNMMDHPFPKKKKKKGSTKRRKKN